MRPLSPFNMHDHYPLECHKQLSPITQITSIQTTVLSQGWMLHQNALRPFVTLCNGYTVLTADITHSHVTKLPMRLFTALLLIHTLPNWWHIVTLKWNHNSLIPSWSLQILIYLLPPLSLLVQLKCALSVGSLAILNAVPTPSVPLVAVSAILGQMPLLPHSQDPCLLASLLTFSMMVLVMPILLTLQSTQHSSFMTCLLWMPLPQLPSRNSLAWYLTPWLMSSLLSSCFWCWQLQCTFFLTHSRGLHMSIDWHTHFQPVDLVAITYRVLNQYSPTAIDPSVTPFCLDISTFVYIWSYGSDFY